MNIFEFSKKKNISITQIVNKLQADGYLRKKGDKDPRRQTINSSYEYDFGFIDGVGPIWDGRSSLGHEIENLFQKDDMDANNKKKRVIIINNRQTSTSQESSQVKNIALIQRPNDWNEEIYCYAYSADDPSIYNETWPGKKMAASVDKTIYSLQIKIPNPLVVFTDGLHQFPVLTNKGYKLSGSMILKDGNWVVYEKEKNKNNPNRDRNEGFRLRNKVTSIPDTPIEVKYIPNENDVLKSNKYGTIKLLQRLGGGGEGDVYRTNTSSIAKIYKQGKLTLRKKKKLELMVSKDISYEGICYPTDLLYYKNEFIGYLMPEAKGEILQTSVFQPMVIKDLFPNWKKKDLVVLAQTILKKIIYLHSHNIILGDINPQNILIVSPNEVYFVDADSYQIEDYPCPVGTVYFTAPELQGKKFETYLRSFGNEHFAIATLLFMLMLPGKAPYAHVGGGSPMENIKEMNFPYPFKGFPEDTPPGFWRFCWSHLPFKLKDAFYKTFMKGETHSSEQTRLDAKSWLALFDEYFFLLDSGRLTEQDEMSNDIFPTRLKRKAGVNYVKCKLCNQEYNEHKLKQGICNNCLNKSFNEKQYFCEKCGAEIQFTNYEYYINGKTRPYTKCRSCFDKENQTYKSERCVNCGTIFEISIREHEFFMKKGWVDPARCKNCRNKKNNVN